MTGAAAAIRVGTDNMANNMRHGTISTMAIHHIGTTKQRITDNPTGQHVIINISMIMHG